MVLDKIYRTCQNYGLDPDIMLYIRMWFRSPGRYGRLMTFVLWDDLCWSLISLLRSPDHWDRGIHAAPDAGGGYGGYLVEKQRETKKRPKNDTSCERSIRWHIQNAFAIFCTKSFKVSFKRNILTEENGKHGKQLICYHKAHNGNMDFDFGMNLFPWLRLQDRALWAYLSFSNGGCLCTIPWYSSCWLYLFSAETQTDVRLGLC
jgi:hypothetical protein